jgi:low temperature requirement protein LtrA
MLVVAAVWWAWRLYAWLMSTIDVDEGGVRLTMLAATTAMLGVALAVPGAFGGDAPLFGVAYLIVGLLHFVLSWIVAREDQVCSNPSVSGAASASVSSSSASSRSCSRSCS